MTDLSLKVTRGDTTFMYAIGAFCVRFHLRLDEKVNPERMRVALDKTAKRYPYFCVTLKKNEKEYYYEPNDAPIALLNTTEKVELPSKESNDHIWAVCYNEDYIYVDFFHGRADATAIYRVIATLLYYYYDVKDSTGVLTLETPITEKETHDPLEDLPTVDLSSIKRPPPAQPLIVSDESSLKLTNGKLIKLTLDEESFVKFAKENNGTPGIMICVLMGRALNRIHSKHERPILCSYTVNARPMLHAEETFHNCTSGAILPFDEVREKPLNEQCAAFREKTKQQTDEGAVQRSMTFLGSMAKMVLDIPNLEKKVQVARQAVSANRTSYVVSYVGRWKQEEIGKHIQELWTETNVGRYPVVELAAVNGRIFISFMQSFDERIYFDALVEELKENGIGYIECSETTLAKSFACSWRKQ